MELKGAEEILAIEDLERVTVECPEWGTGVIVSVMSIAEKEAWARETAKAGDEDTATALLVVYTSRKADGSRLFTRAQVPALAKKSAVVLERLGQAAVKLNRLGSVDLESAQKN